MNCTDYCFFFKYSQSSVLPLAFSPPAALGLKVDSVVVAPPPAPTEAGPAAPEAVLSGSAPDPEEEAEDDDGVTVAPEDGPFCRDLIRLSNLLSASADITPPVEGDASGAGAGACAGTVVMTLAPLTGGAGGCCDRCCCCCCCCRCSSCSSAFLSSFSSFRRLSLSFSRTTCD